MVQTAKRLGQLQLDKTIVLTNAMIPYAFGSSSDEFFNLGCALAFAAKPDSKCLYRHARALFSVERGRKKPRRRSF